MGILLVVPLAFLTLGIVAIHRAQVKKEKLEIVRNMIIYSGNYLNYNTETGMKTVLVDLGNRIPRHTIPLAFKDECPLSCAHRNMSPMASPPPYRREGGTVARVDKEMAKLPRHVLKTLSANGVKIAVVKNSVVDHFPHLKGVRVKAGEYRTWDYVSGSYFPKTREIIYATEGFRGGFNDLLHEAGHAYDHVSGAQSYQVDFRIAWATDKSTLKPYFKKSPKETYAESFAKHYGKSRSFYRKHPNLFNYWRAK